MFISMNSIFLWIANTPTHVYGVSGLPQALLFFWTCPLQKAPLWTTIAFFVDMCLYFVNVCQYLSIYGIAFGVRFRVPWDPFRRPWGISGNCWLLVSFGHALAGHGTPEGVKWDSQMGGSTVSLESGMPDWRALARWIYPKWRIRGSSWAVPGAIRQVPSTRKTGKQIPGDL